jgi:hypothetical protein
MGDAPGLCMVVYGCKAEHGVENRSPGRAQAHADRAIPLILKIGSHCRDT